VFVDAGAAAFSGGARSPEPPQGVLGARPLVAVVTRAHAALPRVKA